MPESDELVRYKQAIKDYIFSNCTRMLREPKGCLRYPFIVAGSVYFDDLWDWDSWLTDIALRQAYSECGHLDKDSLIEYEKGCVLNFLSACTDDGWIPIVINVNDDYSTIRDKHSKMGKNMHKPILAQHAAFISLQSGSFTWLKDFLSRLEAFLNMYEREFFHPCGLYFWKDDFAIGVDNDPSIFYRPENSCGSIYLNTFLYRELLAFSLIKEQFSGKAAALPWVKKAECLKDKINELCWDERDGLYYSVDLNLRPIDPNAFLHKNAPRHWDTVIMRLDNWSNFLPLWAGIAAPVQAERVIRGHILNPRTFNAEYGIRTLSRLEKMYNLRASNNPSNWLGPIWGISNYLTFRGLIRYGYDDQARELAYKTIKLFGRDIEKCGEMHEYYNPDTGEPIIHPGFQNWNLLVLNMIAWLENRPVITEY
ncbi:MAG TPA: trehalase family glycosidase [Clostridia bacterium]|nr:trehalase family glycosidase [Clostridia bacterium]